MTSTMSYQTFYQCLLANVGGILTFPRSEFEFLAPFETSTKTHIFNADKSIERWFKFTAWDEKTVTLECIEG